MSYGLPSYNSSSSVYTPTASPNITGISEVFPNQSIEKKYQQIKVAIEAGNSTSNNDLFFYLVISFARGDIAPALKYMEGVISHSLLQSNCPNIQQGTFGGSLGRDFWSPNLFTGLATDTNNANLQLRISTNRRNAMQSLMTVLATGISGIESILRNAGISLPSEQLSSWARVLTNNIANKLPDLATMISNAGERVKKQEEGITNLTTNNDTRNKAVLSEISNNLKTAAGGGKA